MAEAKDTQSKTQSPAQRAHHAKQPVTVQSDVGTLLFGGGTVYDFYDATLSRESLKALVTRYGWTVAEIAGWGSKNWDPPYAPWNWSRLDAGEQP